MVTGNPPENHEEKPKFRIGSRIYLRAVSKDDLRILTIWINDPEVNQYLKVSYPMSYEDQLKWYESHMHERVRTSVHFAIVLKDSDQIIGVMGLHHIDHKHGTATTGSFIGNKQYWNKGYGTEAKMLVLEYAFNTLNLRKICSMVYDFNTRSKRCLEKCGYHEEGIRKAHIYRNGHYCDEILMAVFRPDFEAKWVEHKKLLDS